MSVKKDTTQVRGFWKFDKVSSYQKVIASLHLRYISALSEVENLPTPIFQLRFSRLKSKLQMQQSWESLHHHPGTHQTNKKWWNAWIWRSVLNFPNLLG